MPKCAACAKDGAQMQCGKCKVARYCSKECQAADWKEHKLVCIPPKANEMWDGKSGITAIGPATRMASVPFSELKSVAPIVSAWILARTDAELLEIHTYGIQHAYLKNAAVVVRECPNTKKLQLSTIETGKGEKALRELGISPVTAATLGGYDTGKTHERIMICVFRIPLGKSQFDVPVQMAAAPKSVVPFVLDPAPGSDFVRALWTQSLELYTQLAVANVSSTVANAQRAGLHG